SQISIIPIPLHKSKLRSRGFNQSELIANALAQCLGYRTPPRRDPISRILARVKKTESQAETKSKAARLENVKNCFSIIENWKLEIGNSSTIVLVDDVLTSGATMDEAVKTLKQAGAENVLAFVLAKA
ncbi:MAG: phosphoribosyltransferase family protein, partial [Patescibacteria group bacterium]